MRGAAIETLVVAKSWRRQLSGPSRYGVQAMRCKPLTSAKFLPSVRETFGCRMQGSAAIQIEQS